MIRRSTRWSPSFLPHRFAEALELHPRVSRVLLAYGTVLLALVVTALYRADLPTAWKAGALAVALATIGRDAWRYRSGGPGAVYRVVVSADGSWRIELREGQPLEAQLLRAWGATRGPVIGLEWRCADGVRYRTWITRWDMPSASWRRLRVRLALA